MPLFQRLFGAVEHRASPAALYRAIVDEARRPFWYADGGVPDTLDGRFDMVATILAVVLIRIEAEGEAGRLPAARLAELFVADMDPQLREMGIGDIVVGKHVGRMMAALGGRIDAYRAALGGAAPLDEAVARNLYRGAVPEPARLEAVSQRLRDFASALAGMPAAAILEGSLPR